MASECPKHVSRDVTSTTPCRKGNYMPQRVASSSILFLNRVGEPYRLIVCNKNLMTYKIMFQKDAVIQASDRVDGRLKRDESMLSLIFFSFLNYDPRAWLHCLKRRICWFCCILMSRSYQCVPASVFEGVCVGIQSTLFSRCASACAAQARY
jgi:hypothetical protein